MYNVDDILARLQKGEKLEDIGNELANAMNEAQEKYVAIQKAEEEKARRAQRTTIRRELLWDVLNALSQYADYTDYGKIVCDWMNELSDNDIAELDAQMIELLKTIEMLAQLNFSFDNIKHVVAPAQENIQKDPKKVTAVNPDKALGDFLKMMGW